MVPTGPTGLINVFRKMNKYLLGVGLATLLLTACTNGEQLDNPSRGTITVAADESFRPLVTQLTEAYAGIYPNVKFNVVFKPEQEAINLMLQDSARIVFTTRTLKPNEQAVLTKLKIPGNATRIATDGVALIINRANTDSLITMNELTGIFSGQNTQWEQLKGGNRKGPITLVFDNNNSSNLDFILKKFNVTDMSKLRIFATKSNREAIEFVKENPSALGFIGVNWISDNDEPLTAELSRNLRVMGVSDKPNPISRDDYYQPFQRALGLEDYPLRRPVYILSRETHPGLGEGLTNYVARDAGALIIEKLGLWPTIPYNREVNITK